jgi:hypothetical protein
LTSYKKKVNSFKSPNPFGHIKRCAHKIVDDVSELQEVDKVQALLHAAAIVDKYASEEKRATHFLSSCVADYTFPEPGEVVITTINGEKATKDDSGSIAVGDKVYVVPEELSTDEDWHPSKQADVSAFAVKFSRCPKFFSASSESELHDVVDVFSRHREHRPDDYYNLFDSRGLVTRDEANRAFRVIAYQRLLFDFHRLSGKKIDIVVDNVSSRVNISEYSYFKSRCKSAVVNAGFVRLSPDDGDYTLISTDDIFGSFRSRYQVVQRDDPLNLFENFDQFIFIALKGFHEFLDSGGVVVRMYDTYPFPIFLHPIKSDLRVFCFPYNDLEARVYFCTPHRLRCFVAFYKPSVFCPDYIDAPFEGFSSLVVSGSSDKSCRGTMTKYLSRKFVKIFNEVIYYNCLRNMSLLDSFSQMTHVYKAIAALTGCSKLPSWITILLRAPVAKSYFKKKFNEFVGGETGLLVRDSLFSVDGIDNNLYVGAGLGFSSLDAFESVNNMEDGKYYPSSYFLKSWKLSKSQLIQLEDQNYISSKFSAGSLVYIKNSSYLLALSAKRNLTKVFDDAGVVFSTSDSYVGNLYGEVSAVVAVEDSTADFYRNIVDVIRGSSRAGSLSRFVGDKVVDFNSSGNFQSRNSVLADKKFALGDAYSGNTRVKKKWRIVVTKKKKSGSTKKKKGGSSKNSSSKAWRRKDLSGGSD